MGREARQQVATARASRVRRVQERGQGGSEKRHSTNHRKERRGGAIEQKVLKSSIRGWGGGGEARHLAGSGCCHKHVRQQGGTRCPNPGGSHPQRYLCPPGLKLHASCFHLTFEPPTNNKHIKAVIGLPVKLPRRLSAEFPIFVLQTKPALQSE